MALIKIKKIASLFFLLTALSWLSMPAYADSAAEAEGFLSQIFDTSYDETDLFHHSLAMLLGGFVFEPFGNAPNYPVTVLAHVLGYGNLIAMVLGVVILVYVIAMGAVNTAASGEFLGKRWSTAALPLRITAGFGLIMPAGSGDGVFSVAQSLVIWMIIVGSNSATFLWNKTAEFVSSGTPIMASSLVYDSNAYLELPNIFHCAAVRSKVGKDHRGYDPNIASVMDASGNERKISYGQLKSEASSLSKYEYIKIDGCGTILSVKAPSDFSSNTVFENYDINSDRKSSWMDKALSNYNNISEPGFSPVLQSAIAFADFMISNNIHRNDEEGSYSVSENTDYEEKVLLAANELLKVSQAYDNFIKSTSSGIITEDMSEMFSENMTKGGWARAGVFFFEQSMLQGFSQTLMSNITKASVSDKDDDYSYCFSNIFGCEDRNREYNSWMKGLDSVSAAASTGSSSQIAGGSESKAIKGDFTSVNKDGDPELSDDVSRSVSMAISQTVLNSLLWMGEDDAKGTGGSTGGTSVTSTQGMTSPFTVVSGLGRGLQQVSVSVWTAGLVVAGVAGFAEANVLTGGSGWGGSFMAVTRYLIATLAPIMMGISTLAFVLAFALPFMPVSMWIMLVCGYFVTAIEALAAISLAVIMMITPEGDGMVGHNFAKALQMVNAIVLRPSLSIIGLIAAISLSYVGFSIMNNLFWSTARLNTGGSLFEVMALIFIYASLAYKLCEYMIGIMYKIPDQIMQWMGGGMAREFGESAASNDIAGSLKTNAAAGGMALGAGMNAIGKGKPPTKKKEDPKDDKAGGEEGSAGKEK